MKLFLFLAIASLLAAAHGPAPSAAAHHHEPAPAPAVDCSSLILNMADCLSFVSNGSTSTKPEGTCCSGLKTVLRTQAECLCEAFKSSAQLGFVLNVSKALTLPSACKLSAPSVATCAMSQSPAAAPGPSPTAGGALSPTGGNMMAPVPTPGNAAPVGRAISLGWLISGIALGLILTVDKM
ncbi:non-specific lipid-transfer protein-like protein At5g64080 [Punica granatum]|uniref:Bifunctional inhibitor/plant lipid transfer protein/seed storage helical domain-containing protein n=2 Tax=Punica granatum TaxID=22663 RepID=A0A218VSQ8_PUNGR|nr:non-specific lipid-transfer protein-like protein At5g64080 [Punica granatum]OWM63587.1 hypothetical protein CDL15_Pgr008130 [Punica granatum]PKI37825.1 hypothetical protein CRG98_041775 [Punica granatum]